jgi:NTE family protein
MAAVTKVPDTQRVLILQGGGALGAYEVGAFKVLAEELPKRDAENGKPNRPLFDIIAGTSIGAINAAILVSSFMANNRNWNRAFENLKEFWNFISVDTDRFIDSNIRFWDLYHGNNKKAASSEAARRYYSAKHFLKNGSPGVFSKPIFVNDERYFDYSISLPNNQWYLYSNEELRETINNPRFAKFPIKTNRNEPRLLIVSTDLADGATVTFDSYSQESKYGRIDKKTGTYLEHTISYEKGIEASHVMASSSIPLFYEYEEIQERKFWDGGILSNTPLREVLHMHRHHWFKEVGDEKSDSKVPDLEVYIVGVWPSSGNGDSGDDKDNSGQNKEKIPTDFDGLKSKLYDINLSDKTEFDEKSAIMVSDLIDIIKELQDLAPKYMSVDKQNEFTNKLKLFLDSKAQSKGRSGGDRSYASLLDGRFRLEGEVVRIELRADRDGISNKAFDLSSSTIENLITQGENDTRDILDRLKKEKDK